MDSTSRSSSIKANLCKLLASKSTRSSYALNHQKKLTKSRWSCSSLSTATSSSFDQPANCSLTRLSEEPHDTCNALHRLSLSKSSDLLAGPEPQASKAVVEAPACRPLPPPPQPPQRPSPSACQASVAQQATTNGTRVVLRDKPTTAAKQQRPKSECIMANPVVVHMRNRRGTGRSAARHSTIEVDRLLLLLRSLMYWGAACLAAAGSPLAVWSAGGVRAPRSSGRRLLCYGVQGLQQVSRALTWGDWTATLCL